MIWIFDDPRVRHEIVPSKGFTPPGALQLGSKTWPFCASFGGLIAVRATAHNPKVVSSNLPLGNQF
jgi:hypothetical protein